MPRPITAVIHRQALQNNLAVVRKVMPNSKVFAVVKANAYGHGIERVYEAFKAADGFALLDLGEAKRIRALGWTGPILLLEGIFSPQDLFDCVQYQLSFTIHSEAQIEWVEKHPYPAQFDVCLKMNSGMNRLGFKIDVIKNVINQLKAEGFTCVLAMHFANADAEHPLNEQQIQQFLEVKNDCAPLMGSCCNSAAIYKYPELHFDFVRPGIMLYGATPFADKTVHDLDLKPVMTFTAEVIALNNIKAGEHVGYGSTFTADKDMTLAIVSIGYGDGYPRAFPKQNYVAIHGQQTRVIGRVAMDMIAIDATGLNLELGTEVELWGKSRLVDDVAEANGTIGYELLCRMSARPVRKLV